MELNADFSKRASAHAASTPFVPSPMAGVERRMLDRIGDEVARATTIVRFAPGSAFSPHTHDGGEEYLVLDGVFQDEMGDFPTGYYVRNPPTSSHTPASQPGCTIFVKLWQMDPDDRNEVHVDTASEAPIAAADRPGVSILPLHRDANEDVRVETWEPGAKVTLDLPGGLEVLVISGSFDESGETFTQQSWLRLPAGSALNAEAGETGTKVWIKTGHLARTPMIPAP
ncbi:cupin domain-containing protein [Rhodobacteraceae bacterium NNCM2]|nr:cupin domain-containing protein [Coraliihabitans acroporae]